MRRVVELVGKLLYELHFDYKLRHIYVHSSARHVLSNLGPFRRSFKLNFVVSKISRKRWGLVDRETNAFVEYIRVQFVAVDGKEVREAIVPEARNHSREPFVKVRFLCNGFRAIDINSAHGRQCDASATIVVAFDLESKSVVVVGKNLSFPIVV